MVLFLSHQSFLRRYLINIFWPKIPESPVQGNGLYRFNYHKQALVSLHWRSWAHSAKPVVGTIGTIFACFLFGAPSHLMQCATRIHESNISLCFVWFYRFSSDGSKYTLITPWKRNYQPPIIFILKIFILVHLVSWLARDLYVAWGCWLWPVKSLNCCLRGLVFKWDLCRSRRISHHLVESSSDHEAWCCAVLKSCAIVFLSSRFITWWLNVMFRISPNVLFSIIYKIHKLGKKYVLFVISLLSIFYYWILAIANLLDRYLTFHIRIMKTNFFVQWTLHVFNQNRPGARSGTTMMKKIYSSLLRNS